MLTEEEESVDLETREYRFDIDLLADRVDGILRWLELQDRIGNLEIGLFGSNTGAAAALSLRCRGQMSLTVKINVGSVTNIVPNVLTIPTVAI